MSTDHPLEISVTEARDRLAAPGGALLIDVREPYETEICRVAGAELIPMRQIPARAATLPRDRPLLVMCHHGGRSRQVTQYLRAQGFDAAINIAGGIDAWAAEIEPGMARY